MGREQSIDITEKRQAATLKSIIFQPESDEAVMETHFSKQTEWYIRLPQSERKVF